MPAYINICNNDHILTWEISIKYETNHSYTAVLFKSFFCPNPKRIDNEFLTLVQHPFIF